jgi:hypothetical protein
MVQFVVITIVQEPKAGQIKEKASTMEWELRVWSRSQWRFWSLSRRMTIATTRGHQWWVQSSWDLRRCRPSSTSAAFLLAAAKRYGNWDGRGELSGGLEDGFFLNIFFFFKK